LENTSFVKKITAADLSVCGQARSFLQSALWGAFKARFGWKERAFLVEWMDEQGQGETLPLLALYRRIAPGVGMTYVPWGPELPAFYHDAKRRFAALDDLAHGLRHFLPRNTAFLRFDPPWHVQEGGSSPHAKRAAADIQPPDTVLVDLKSAEQDILVAMKPKWRYNTILAKKKGVVVERLDEAGLELFYRLLTETASRDGIAIHHFEYYQTLFEVCRNSTIAHNENTIAHNSGSVPAELRLYAAFHEGETLAAIVVLFRGKEATYLYGASSNNKRNLMAPYALQWQAMRDAKEAGCEIYDLFGIPPNDNPDHPMYGLYRFKTGFGGAIVHRCGSWDYVYRPVCRALFNAAEKTRKKLRDLKKR
jgi:lipid II:glycine glycyltransferase (peptidoglycan interpeptide bridge formation enzyme)